MKTSLPLPSLPAGGTWKVAFACAGGHDMHWNARLADTLRTEIAQALSANPTAGHFERRISPLVTVTAVRVSAPDAPLTIHLDDQVQAQLRYAQNEHNGNLAASSPTGIPFVMLPSVELTELCGQLRGVDGIIGDIVHDLRLRQGGFESWTAATGVALPPPLLRQLRQTAPIYLAQGRPGTGKTSVLTAAANAFCAQANLPGAMFTVDTGSIRSRHIGASAENLRAVFDAAIARPEPIRFVLVDEAEIVGSRRSIEAVHHEDRSLAIELIRLLDHIAAHPLVVVLLATNRIEALDPAIRRRASMEFAFDRPDAELRRQLLEQWFPALLSREYEGLVRASHGMTPAGINTTLAVYYRTLIRTGEPPSPRVACQSLRRAPRTEDV